MKKIILVLFSFLVFASALHSGASIPRATRPRRANRFRNSGLRRAYSNRESSNNVEDRSKQVKFRKLSDSSKNTKLSINQPSASSTRSPAIQPTKSSKGDINVQTKKTRQISNRPTVSFEFSRVETLKDLKHLQQETSSKRVAPSRPTDAKKDLYYDVIGLPPLSSDYGILTDSDTCYNDNNFTVGDKTCRWIGKANETIRQEHCVQNEVKTHCPQACGSCCKDDRTFAFNFTKNCNWLHNTIDTFRERQCARAEVRTFCPVACELCDPNTIVDDRSDLDCADDALFVVKTEEKDCEWIQARPEMHEKMCKRLVVQEACPVTCGMCREPITHVPSPSPSIDPSAFPTHRRSSNPSAITSLVHETSVFPSFTSSTVSPSSGRSNDPSMQDLQTLHPSAIGKFPSSIPTTTSDILSSGPSVDCFDDPSYEAPFGGDCGCELFQGTMCSDWSALLSCDQLDEIYDRCPESCGMCR